MRHGVHVALTGKLAEVSSRVICLDSKRLYVLSHHFGPICTFQWSSEPGSHPVHSLGPSPTSCSKLATTGIFSSSKPLLHHPHDTSPLGGHPSSSFPRPLGVHGASPACLDPPSQTIAELPSGSSGEPFGQHCGLQPLSLFTEEVSQDLAKARCSPAFTIVTGSCVVFPRHRHACAIRMQTRWSIGVLK